MPSRSYSLKRKAWEELNRIIVATVPYDNSMVDPDFNLNEHNRLFEAAMFLIDHEDDFGDYQLQVAEDVLEKTCYGHRVHSSAGNLVLAYYEEAQEKASGGLELFIAKPQPSLYTIMVALGDETIMSPMIATPSEVLELVEVLVHSLNENKDLPEDFLKDLEGEQ